MTETFESKWLALREPVDIVSRSPALADAFLDCLPANPRILDLGAGTGSNARYLQTRAAARGMTIDWLLVDGDVTLLDRVVGLPRFDRQVADFAADPGVIDVSGVDGVAASALFDLVSEGWFAKFVAHIAGRPLLAALTADGGHRWDPEDPVDTYIDVQFAADMSRDKGFGPAMGLVAATGMASVLDAAGYAVQGADTPWLLGCANAALVAAMIGGIADAANRHGERADVTGWRHRRNAGLAAENLHLTVGHRDLLAIRG